MKLQALLQLSRYARADESLIPNHMSYGIPDKLRAKRVEITMMILHLPHDDSQLDELNQDRRKVDEALKVYSND